MPKLELPKIEVPKIALTSLDLPDVPVPAAVARPVYAGVGATDLAVEIVRGYVTDVQAKVNARVADVQKSVKGFEVPQPKSLQDKAVAQLTDTRTKFEAKLAELQADAKAFPAKAQTKLDENVATLTKQYADLAKRGESVVIKIRKGDEVKAPAKTPGSVAKKAPAKKTPAKKAPAKKATAKKAPAKKATAN
jgi:hypothetical protein